MTLSGLIPELEQFGKALIDECGRAGLRPQLTSTVRSFSAQARLYKAYLAGRTRYPAAVPGTSAHEYGWAFDMIVHPIEALTDVGRLWESWGGVWGGRYHDPVHFEFPGFQAPKNTLTDVFLEGIYRTANFASYVVTPLAVERNTGGYANLASGVDRLLGP